MAAGVKLGSEVGMPRPGIEQGPVFLSPDLPGHPGAYEPVDRLAESSCLFQNTAVCGWLVRHELSGEHPAGQVSGTTQTLEVPPPPLTHRGAKRKAQSAHGEAKDELPLGQQICRLG